MGVARRAVWVGLGACVAVAVACSSSGSSGSSGGTGGDGSSGGSSGSSSGGTAYTGPCKWPGTIVAASLLAVDGRNDVFYLAGEEVRRVRCETGEMDAEPVGTDWVQGRVGGDGLVIDTHRPDPTNPADKIRARDFKTSTVRWERPAGTLNVIGVDNAGYTLLVETTDGSTGILTSVDPAGTVRFTLPNVPTTSVVLARTGYFIVQDADGRSVTVYRPDGTRGHTVNAEAFADAAAPRYAFGLGPDGSVAVYATSALTQDLTAYGPDGARGSSTLIDTPFIGSGVSYAPTLTSEGIALKAGMVKVAAPGQQFHGTTDYLLVAMAKNSDKVLWYFQGGGAGRDNPSSVLTDDSGDILFMGNHAEASERRIYRIDPQTGKPRGAVSGGTQGCAGKPTDFNGMLGSPCAPKGVSFQCSAASGSLIAAKCDAATCTWQGDVCQPRPSCNPPDAQCNPLNGCLGGKCGI